MLRELLQALPGEGPGDPDLFPGVPVYDGPVEDKGDGRTADAKAGLRPEGLPVYGSSYSGLNAVQRAKVRAAIKQAIAVSFAHSGQMAYTQGAQRWQGIAQHKVASKGQFPTESDCSSWTTWVLWNGLYLLYKKPDIVNGDRWAGGFTGTAVEHGKTVHDHKNIQLGDVAIYGSSLSDTEHEAECIGGGFVASHGQPGVVKRELEYRKDLLVVKRMV